jgi:hypothetical protein
MMPEIGAFMGCFNISHLFFPKVFWGVKIPKRKMEKLFDLLILVISSFFFIFNIVMLEKYLLDTQLMNF